MPEMPEGAPCWVDAILTDLEAGKRFYGELLGWTFQESAAEFGGYTTALSDGRTVGALSPPAAGQGAPTAAWTLYFHSADIEATAAKVQEHGGTLLFPPMAVGDQGTMLLAKDPAGAVFGAWQPSQHHGWEKCEENGSFCWAELATDDVATADAFYPAVLPITARRMGDESGMDYKVWTAGDTMLVGRYPISASTPGPRTPQFEIYFAVPDCDAAAATAAKLGGTVLVDPVDSPYGRYARVADPEGATFAVLDASRTVGEAPSVEE